MPCSEHHFIPILDELRQTPDPELPPGTQPETPEPPSIAKIAGRTWGGHRPGAGAPKGNLNALKDGRHSARYRRLVQSLALLPEVRDTLIGLGEHRRHRQRLAEAGASELLAGLLQRAGEIVLHPESNHVENNQALLDFLRSAELKLRALSKMQSREARQIDRSIKQQARRRPPPHSSAK